MLTSAIDMSTNKNQCLSSLMILHYLIKLREFAGNKGKVTCSLLCRKNNAPGLSRTFGVVSREPCNHHNIALMSVQRIAIDMIIVKHRGNIYCKGCFYVDMILLKAQYTFKFETLLCY